MKRTKNVQPKRTSADEMEFFLKAIKRTRILSAIFCAAAACYCSYKLVVKAFPNVSHRFLYQPLFKYGYNNYRMMVRAR